MGRFGLSGPPGALGGFDYHAVADGFGGNLDADNFAVDKGADFLDIGFELPLAYAGGPFADAAEACGFTASGDRATEGRKQ